jgi:hypothetical protein
MSPISVSDFTVDTGSGSHSIAFTNDGIEHSFVVFDAAANALSPTVTAETSSTLDGSNTGADYLIIAASNLVHDAQTLADYRSEQGLTTMVVDIAEVFDRYGGGNPSPDAIGTFLQHASSNWVTPPRYAVLIGTSSVDYRDHLGFGVPQIPPKLIDSPRGLFASDVAYLGALLNETIALGRIPVENGAELAVVIEKIKSYETQDSANKVSFFADVVDGTVNFADLTVAAAQTLPDTVEQSRNLLDTLGLDAARTAITTALAQPHALINYMGHATMEQLHSGGLLSTDDVALLDNASTLPIVSVTTCLAGRYEFPGVLSLGEALLKQPGGGAAAFFGPSGFADDLHGQLLLQSWTQALFEGGHERLGDAVAAARQAFVDAGGPEDMAMLYNTIGDPAMMLRLPTSVPTKKKHGGGCNNAAAAQLGITLLVTLGIAARRRRRP